MDIKEYAEFSYDTGDHTKNWLIFAVIVAIIISMLAGFNLSPWCFLLLLLPIGLIIHIVRADYDKSLLISSRYLILGDRIIYFRNVSRAVMDRNKQLFTISENKGASLTISASGFPTNARKTEKIRINKTAKFEKVTGKIIARLNEISPDIVLL